MVKSFQPSEEELKNSKHRSKRSASQPYSDAASVDASRPAGSVKDFVSKFGEAAASDTMQDWHSDKDHLNYNKFVNISKIVKAVRSTLHWF